MSICLQVGIGLLPGIIIAIILMFKRRAFNFKVITLLLILLLADGWMVFLGINDTISTRAFEAHLSQKEMLSFANALAVEGAYNEALEVIDEYSSDYGYDNDCRLLTARIKLLDGDYESANGLYNYLVSNTGIISSDADEVQFANRNTNSNAADLVMLQYLQEIGENIEDYGFTTTSYNELMKDIQVDPDDIKKDVKKAIQGSYSINENIQNCALIVYDISQAYHSLPDNEQDSTGKKYRRAFYSIENDSPKLLSLECVKKARIKAYILAGDYDAITKKLGEHSSYHELMISAELYMSGIVKKSDFSEEYQMISNSDVSAVRNQINKIYEKVHKNLSTIESKNLKARVSAISNQLKDSALVTIKEQLMVSAEEEAGANKTKVCLELAKIEDYFGNETSTDTYLGEAIYSSQDCEDDSYVFAMSEIINVINNDEDDLENIKNVSAYVDTVLDHSLTVDIEEIVSPQHQNTSIQDNENTANQFIENNMNQDNEDAEETDNSNTVDFAQSAVDYVSRAKSAISIGRVDTTNFPNITSKVQISSNYLKGIDDIKNAVKIYDCGAEVTDFTLNKIDYTGSNIILVCDISGSMGGSIQDLRDAVVTFINNKNAGENLSVITFNDTIVDTKSFGTSDESLISFAEAMQADGGTDMFSAVVNCLGSFSTEDDTNDILILMTDGQDNNPKSSETIYDEIGSLAISKDVTVYTLGLGTDVDTAYLNYIADSGNGKSVYVSDSSSLSSFYNMLHERVNNQYELTYEAIDTFTMSGRTLEVTLPSDKTRDIKNYSMGTADEDDNGLDVLQNLSISGMSPRYVYKGLQDTEVKLKGTGFSQDKSITVKLNGNIDYTIQVEYIDAETYKLTIPSSVAVGTYNVEITLAGKKKILQNGFSVIVQGNEKKTEFGPYVFTSAEKIENSDGSYNLRGAVTLNGWLRFKGDVSLAGDLAEGGSINVSDYSGSYVVYSKDTAEGIGSFLAEKGIGLDIPALYDFKLYNDQQNLYDYSKYMVDDISTGFLEIHQLVHFDSPTIRLYPNSIGLYYSTGTTILPYQKQILKATGSAGGLFNFNFDGNAQVTNKSVGIVMDVSYGESKDDYSHQINLLNSPVYFNGNFKVKLNTLKNEYTVGAMVRLAFFAKQSGLGAEISWKEQLIPDSVKLSLDKAQAVKLPTAFPIEANKFNFTVSDINSAIAKGNFLSLTFTGSATFSSMKLKEYIPQIGKIVGDITLLEMPDTTATVRLSPLKFEANATLKFLSEIQIAQADVKLGNFDYTNSLLLLDSANVTGLSAALKLGIMWNTADKRISLDLSGTGELDAHTRFVGVDMTGTAEFNFNWWIINNESKATGEFALGLYTTQNDKQQFVFTYKSQESNGKVKGKFYYIDENGKCGKINGNLK